MLVLDIGIFLCIAIVGYCYVLYPYVIRFLAATYPEASFTNEEFLPTLSIILSVHNEEKVLERCLKSLLELDYPHEKVELIIGSDGSHDRTNEILSHFAKANPIIKPNYFQQQRGKIPVLNDIVAQATGEILFFLDADIELSVNTLRAHVRHYANPQVGAVAGLYSLESRETSIIYISEKEYTAFEQQIRMAESVYHATVGLAGCNYTMRRSLWRPLPDTLVHDDLFVVLSVLDQGYRIYFEPRSVASEQFGRSLMEEFWRKSRFASRGYHTLSFFRHLLMPRAGKTAFLLWSHKLVRWASPFLALAVLVLALVGFFAYGNWLYTMILAGFSGLAIIAAIGLIAERWKKNIPLIRQASWLVVMNAAYVSGTVKYLTKTDDQIWRSTTRVSGANH